jgi:hypothetical protein
MATITAKLAIASSDLTSNSISLTSAFKITATATTGLARRPVTSTAIGTALGQVVLYTADDFAATAYIYIKNVDSTATDYLYVYANTAADDPVILKLSGGEATLLPTRADATLTCYAATSGTIVEWMVFGTDQ